MRPDDLSLLRVPGAPAPAADGSVLVAVAVPEPTVDRYLSRIVRLRSTDPVTGPVRFDDPGIAFGAGDADTDPVLSPDGTRLALRRTVRPGAAGPDGHPQLFVLPVDGGEAQRVTDHPLGAGRPVFSPDGRWLVHPAAVPADGRYGTDPDVDADAEPARRIDRFTYRSDGSGFVLDRVTQLFAVDLDAARPADPRLLTAEPGGARDPMVRADSRSVVYVRPAGVDRLTDELASVQLPAGSGSDVAAAGRLVAVAAGSAARPVPVADGILYYGMGFTGTDAAARTTGLWWVPDGGSPSEPVRLTDEQSVDLDPDAGPPVATDRGVLVAALHRGTVSVRRVPFDLGRPTVRTGAPLPELPELPELVGAGRLVRSFAVRGDRLVAVVADRGSTGEVVAVDLSAEQAADEQVLTDLGAELRAAGGVRAQQEVTATAPDGHPVHGFLVVPDGPGPHPVLLVVHGGPHAAHSAAFFDEAQVYATAGYAVVLPNPRGSAGYGQEHARAVLHRLGTVDADDVLALLDAVRARPDCDADRVGVMGGSYGGFMTGWLLGHHPGRFVAGLSERAVNAWDSFAGSSDIGWWFTDVYVGADRDRQWAASPLATADAIDRPLLIVHSEQDWRCPLEQAQRLFVALRRRGADVEMVLFPGEGHELSRSGRPRHRRQRLELVLDWWRRHLPVMGDH